VWRKEGERSVINSYFPKNTDSPYYTYVCTYVKATWRSRFTVESRQEIIESVGYAWPCEPD